MTEPVLLIGYGNLGRGDDGLGILAVETIAAHGLARLECLITLQLQIEHVTDLLGCERLIFVDADVRCPAPFTLSPIAAQRDHSYSSHALTPAALLYVFQQVYGKAAPPAHLLRIRGYQFDLGEQLSIPAQHNLQVALQTLRRIIER